LHKKEFNVKTYIVNNCIIFNRICQYSVLFYNPVNRHFLGSTSSRLGYALMVYGLMPFRREGRDAGVITKSLEFLVSLSIKLKRLYESPEPCIEGSVSQPCEVHIKIIINRA